ncbi:hypothetical protein [Hydrogenophaga sp.]
MQPYDDPTLIAYLDGQLPEQDYAPLEQALAESAALRERLQALAQSSELARRSFDPVFLEPVPPHLIAEIWRASDPRARRDPPPTPPVRRRWLDWTRLGNRARPWPALASVVMLGLGAVIGWQLLSPSTGVHWAQNAGTPLTDPALALALEVAPSGRVLPTEGGSIEVVASFERHNGGHCREFNRTNTAGTRDELGIACRNDKGLWQLEFLIAEQRPAQTGASVYQTASDRQLEAADSFLQQQVRGAALAERDEQALIARGWAR